MTVRGVAVCGAALLVAAAGAGCARQERFPPPPRDPSIPAADTSLRPEPPRPVALRVENRHRSDIVVYATRGASRTRLGTVVSQSTAELVIPATFVGDPGGLTLIADPVAGRGVSQTPVFTLRNGQRVIWTVETNPARSSVGIY